MPTNSKQWRDQALKTYDAAVAEEKALPGSMHAVELFARAGAEASIAVAFAVGGAAPVKRTPRAKS